MSTSFLQFEGHRPYFRLLLEESWVATPEFTGPPTNYGPSTTDCVSELWYASPDFPTATRQTRQAPSSPYASRVSCSELLGGMPGLQTEGSVRIGFSGLGLLWLYRRGLGLKELGETLFSPSRIWAASLT